jgi:hypothetical protein
MAAACAQAATVKPQAHHLAAPQGTPVMTPPAGPRGGVNPNAGQPIGLALSDRPRTF